MLGNIPLILISSANINKKIDINVTSALKMMFYNTKKICIKQITQIFFKLLLITGGLLIVFFEGMGARGTGDGIAWNGGKAPLDRAGAGLLLSLPDTHYLATDGNYIQSRNYQEESKA